MEADSLFAQTLRELDTIFYATFPAASQSKFQEEAAHEQLHLHHYYGDEAPPLECARPSTRSTYDRPSHALQPAHPYQHFSKHYRRVSPNLPLQRPPPPAQGHLHALPAKLVIPKPPSEKNDHQPLENKPLLACFFCRGRKLSCGRPLSGRPDKICGCVPLISFSVSADHPAVSVTVAHSGVNTPQRAGVEGAQKSLSMSPRQTPHLQKHPLPIQPHLPDSNLSFLFSWEHYHQCL